LAAYVKKGRKGGGWELKRVLKTQTYAKSEGEIVLEPETVDGGARGTEMKSEDSWGGKGGRSRRGEFCKRGRTRM